MPSMVLTAALSAPSVRACSSKPIASFRRPRSNARWACSSACWASRIKEDVGLRVTNQPLHCSTTIEEAFPWLDKLNEGKHRQDSQPEQDRSHHNIPSLFLLSFCGTSSTGQDELELRIANRTHLGQVEPFEFFFRAHSLAHE